MSTKEWKLTNANRNHLSKPKSPKKLSSGNDRLFEKVDCRLAQKETSASYVRAVLVFKRTVRTNKTQLIRRHRRRIVHAFATWGQSARPEVALSPWFENCARSCVLRRQHTLGFDACRIRAGPGSRFGSGPSPVSTFSPISNLDLEAVGIIPTPVRIPNSKLISRSISKKTALSRI